MDRREQLISVSVHPSFTYGRRGRAVFLLRFEIRNGAAAHCIHTYIAQERGSGEVPALWPRCSQIQPRPCSRMIQRCVPVNDNDNAEYMSGCNLSPAY